MPDLFDTIPAPELPSPGHLRRIQRSRAPVRKDAPFTELETPREPGCIIVEIDGVKLREISYHGVIGELDRDAMDVLAGFIAMANGVGHHGLSCHEMMNPGGFGHTLRLDPHLLPRGDTRSWQPWMRSISKDTRFESWDEGGIALTGWLEAIRDAHVPYFFKGEMTPVGEVLDTFEFNCDVNRPFKWSVLLAKLSPEKAAV